MEDYTQDPMNPGWSYTGDPSQESNWIYNPPGEPADPNWWNFVPLPDGSGGWTGYQQGEPAPVDAATFSNPDFNGQGPNADQRDQSVIDWVDTNLMGGTGGYAQRHGLGSVVSEGVPAPGGYGTSLSAEAQAGLYPGPQATGATTATGETPAGGTKAPRWAARAQAMRDAGLPEWIVQAFEQQQQDLEDQKTAQQSDAQKLLEAARRKAAQEQTNFETTQAGLTRRQEIQAQGAERAARVSAQGQRESARISAESRLQGEERAAQTSQQSDERKQKLALVSALLQMSTGPNGPANRQLAIRLGGELGLNLGSTGGGGQTMGPNGIPPGLWDALPPAAKQLLLDAWQAQGGDPKDFQFAINAQRPQGQPSTPRIRYAAPVGA